MESNDKRVYAGYYKRYDRQLIYVISTAKDADTGEDTVIYMPYSLTKKYGYFTVSKRSFCEPVIIDGKEFPKYRRQTQKTPSANVLNTVKATGFRGPIRRPSDDDDYDLYVRRYQSSPTYYEYARDICKNYKKDIEAINECIKLKRYLSISKEDFYKAHEDVKLLKSSIATRLKEYKEFFHEHFVQGISIRKYAERHGINRGSVELIQKKLFKEFAAILYERDVSEGKTRIKPKKNKNT